MKNNILLSIVASSIYMPNNTIQSFLFFHILSHFFFLSFYFIMAILTDMKWYLTVILICTFLSWWLVMLNIFSEVYWPHTYVFLWKKYIFSSSAHILTKLFEDWVARLLYISWILTLSSDVSFENFSHSVGCRLICWWFPSLYKRFLA